MFAPYCRVFSTQYGGMGYKMKRPSAKSRYLNFQQDSRYGGNGEARVDEAVSVRKNRSVSAHTRNAALAFDAADTGMDGELSFEGFKRLVEERMPSRGSCSESQLRTWFDALDVDGNGVLTKSEYFAFAVREAVLFSGSGQGIAEFFKDSDADSKLSKDAFVTLAERLGFGGLADELFASMDIDGDGLVHYHEFVAGIKARTSSTGGRGFIAAMSKAGVRPAVIVKPSVVGNSRDRPAVVRDELVAILLANGASTLAFLKEIDQNNDGLLTAVELSRALARLNYDVPPSVVQSLYDEIDRDLVQDGEDGGVTTKGMNVWMLARLDHAEQSQQTLRDDLHMRGQELTDLLTSWLSNQEDDAVSPTQLARAIAQLGLVATPEMASRFVDELGCDRSSSGSTTLSSLSNRLLRKLEHSEQLRQDLRDMLRRNGSSVFKLLAQWDADGSDSIDEAELSLALSALGYEVSQDIVGDIFRELDSDGDGKICSQEISSFLLQKVNSERQVFEALAESMRLQGERLVDYFRKVDGDGDALISQDEARQPTSMCPAASALLRARLFVPRP